VYPAAASYIDVERSQCVFTAGQRKRAALYKRAHETYMYHTSPERIASGLAAGIIRGCPFTEADVRNAKAIYGDCPICFKTKSPARQKTGTYPFEPEAPGSSLVGTSSPFSASPFF